MNYEKLMRSIESFVPIGSEERVKRAGVQLEQESSKKQKIVVEDVPVTEEKVEVVKKEEPIKRTGKRKKQKARKGSSFRKEIFLYQADVFQAYLDKKLLWDTKDEACYQLYLEAAMELRRIV
ncbi:hypothetical protein Tco_0320972 [Tanacetum coccineum]